MSNVLPKDQINEGSQEHTGVIAFFRSLPNVGGACAHIFDRGEYYSVHGDTARLAAATVFHTNAVIKKRGYGAHEMDTVFLSRNNFESFVRELLLVKQYRLSIYRQQTQGKNDWYEEFKASPGNLTQLEDVLFGGVSEQSSSAGIMAVKVTADAAQKVVGVGFVDVASHVIRVCQFLDTDTFTNLEALIVQLGPKECLLPNGEAKTKLAKTLERSGMLITERKRSEFNSSDSVQDLGRLVKGWSSSSTVTSRPEMERTQALAAISAIVKYLELTSDDGNFNQFKCSLYELDQFMRLDTAAIKALHVDSSTGLGASQQQHNGTILSVLDKCRTGPGHRMMARWLRQPLLDIKKIEERHDLVSAFVSSVELRNSVGDQHLRRIPDLPRITRRLARRQATLIDCHKLYQCAEGLPDLCEAIGRYNGSHASILSAIFLTPLQESVGDLSKFVEMVETTVDLEQVRQGQYIIKADFDEELTALKDAMDLSKDSLQSHLRAAANDLGLDAGKTIKLEHNNQHGHFFRVTLKDEKSVRNNRAYQMLDTNKSGVKFRNTRLADADAHYAEHLRKYEQQQASVVTEILNIASGYVEVIQSLSSTLTTLDCIVALASAAVTAPVPYVRPTMLVPGDQSTLELVQCRHPCLELQDSVSYIPNDTVMGADGGKFHIITGPNMGGKSTYLRGVATAVLMAQIGSFVPCTSARIPVMDAILARVGAGDCQQRGVSTFLAEMIETATIIKSATRNSLIIVDELGRGTSTYDGFGIAWAISEHISRDLASYCLFATHFHELTALADVQPSVRNFHVAATTAEDTLTLLYQVLPGPCDRSFGIHCAKIAHFPDKVVEYAKRKAEELEDDFAADDTDDSAETVNNRRRCKKEGEEVIVSALQSAAALSVDELSDEKLEDALSHIRVTAISSQNSYIEHLLAVAAAAAAAS
uniref:DNA mismatch repair protein MSH2 n=2 Tax=Hirondellea gigas TaxID=1518452 RepID=A0A2P2I8C1_9CRUS